jgi:uncharacterized membrane protein YuzA (DUF378 family)
MKALNIVTLILVIVGAVNWGLVGLFQLDLVAALFGGQDAGLARIVYVLVGISGFYQLYPLMDTIAGHHGTGDLAAANRR